MYSQKNYKNASAESVDLKSALKNKVHSKGFQNS